MADPYYHERFQAIKHLGSCAGLDPSIFYPEDERGPRVEQAKAVCATCPIRIPCLDYAIWNRESFGVWGGLTTRERGRFRRTITLTSVRIRLDRRLSS